MQQYQPGRRNPNGIRKVLVLAVVAFLCCCQKAAPTEDRQALATAMFEAFNKHDWQKMASYYADDADFLDPSFGKEFIKQTRKDVIAKYAEMQQLFPDINDEITAMHLAGESVIVQFISRGTTADGIKFELPIITVLTFRSGLIVRDATYYDLENE